MRRDLSAWLAAPPAERRLLGEAWLLLLGVGAALRCLPLPRVQALLRQVGRRGIRPSLPPDRLAWIVGAAARRQLRTVSCLERSLVLQALLARRGPYPELRIGVRREGEALQAHAWIEVEGRPVGEPEDVARRFLPFPEGLAE